jgi:hypothetical protein
MVDIVDICVLLFLFGRTDLHVCPALLLSVASGHAAVESECCADEMNGDERWISRQIARGCASPQ